jgi:TonB family protein
MPTKVLITLCISLVTLITASGQTTNDNLPQQISVIKAVAPAAYPPLARGASGKVVVELTIDSEGNVTAAKAIKGNPLLYNSSLVAARKWQFSSEKDKDIRFVYVTFNFAIANKKEDEEISFSLPYEIKYVLLPYE